MSRRLLAISAIVVLFVFRLFLFQAKAQQQSGGFLPVAPEKAIQTYLGLRNGALHSTSGKVKPPKSLRPSDPWAILMDWPTGDRTATTAAFADGTVSIYISNGGGFLGGGQKYASVRKAGENMLALAREFQPQMHATKDYPLPPQGQVNFYLVTNSGVFTISAPESECKTRTHPLTRLYFAGQEIITQYRLALSWQ